MKSLQYTIEHKETCEIIIDKHILNKIGNLITKQAYTKIAVLLDSTTEKLFWPAVKTSLDATTIPYTVIKIAPGEKSKDFTNLGNILTSCYNESLDRKSAIIALGGGVVGDIATLAAGLYFRGIDCIQVPTTLLSQVDSALGGKGAVDISNHKNTIGIIRQPRFILIDTETITSLPENQLRSGLGEVIKYAIAMDQQLFDLLAEKNAKDHLDEIIARCVDLKMHLIAKDPQDTTTQRAVVNFGHTLGQAIELQTQLLHGEAIAVGMAFAIRLSQKLQMLSATDAERSLALLIKYNLPTTITGLDKETIIKQMQKDKKSVGGSPRFVLLEGVGKPKANCIVEKNTISEVLSEVLV